MIALLSLLSTQALAATTILGLDSGQQQAEAGGFTCGSAEPLSVTASTSFTLAETVVADLTDFEMALRGRHGLCTVTLDHAELTLNGEVLWAQQLSAEGSSQAFTDWYLTETFSRADLPRMVLEPGTYTLALTLDGSGESASDAIEARVVSSLEYGRDWDDDGYASSLLGGEDCDDRDAEINPSADEIIGDKKDNDCDGEIDPTEEPGDTDTGGVDTGDAPGGDDTGSDGLLDTGGLSSGLDDPGLIAGGACSATAAPRGGAGLLALALGALWRRRRRS